MPLLTGLDGAEKMSKSLGNAIGFFESADTQFGKVMSVRDPLMWEWYRLLTDKLPAEIERLREGHPMDAKKSLAREIVTRFHGAAEACEAQERWIRRFSERCQDESMALQVEVAATGLEEPLHRLLVRTGCCSSSREAQRRIAAGAVFINGARVQDPRSAWTSAPTIGCS